jgi:hypothetical protein
MMPSWSLSARANYNESLIKKSQLHELQISITAGGMNLTVSFLFKRKERSKTDKESKRASGKVLRERNRFCFLSLSPGGRRRAVFTF